MAKITEHEGDRVKPTDKTIAVVGLGYVGLPLAVAFGKQQPTIGYDLNDRKVEQYRDGVDPSREVSPEDLAAATGLRFTTDPTALYDAEIVIVAVPTPIDTARRPDLKPLQGASRTVGENLRPGTTIVYESTVFPGATEEVCIPIIERHSRLKWREDFHVGYSPERINPGDTQHKLADIVKVVAGDRPETLRLLTELYGSVVPAGIHQASSIKVAEAAKVIENTQRDLNIALMNELALIFNELGIDTTEVLDAAGTKWNFLPFRPGLVGGHCIGVDPYYLTYKAEMIGYHPEVILAGRRINDNVGKFVADQTLRLLIDKGDCIKDSKVAVLGLTFKENCPDLRNTRVIDIVRELASFGIEVMVHDPWVDPAEARAEYELDLFGWDELPQVDGMILAVPHREFKGLGAQDYLGKIKPGGPLVDVKSALDRTAFDDANLRLWRL